MTVSSFGGYNYYVTFIDDHSWKTWIYFLKTKESEELLSKFKEFKAQVENLSGRRIKILRSDNGGEYTSIEFNDLCKEAELRGSSQFPTTLNKMGLQKERTEQLWRQPKAWYMTKVYQCSYGQKHPEQLFMYKIDALIKSWRTWLRKKPSQEWSQKWATFVSLDAQSTFMCPRIKRLS